MYQHIFKNAGANIFKGARVEVITIGGDSGNQPDIRSFDFAPQIQSMSSATITQIGPDGTKTITRSGGNVAEFDRIMNMINSPYGYNMS